jgi:hypothetical protein
MADLEVWAAVEMPQVVVAVAPEARVSREQLPWASLHKLAAPVVREDHRALLAVLLFMQLVVAVV